MSRDIKHKINTGGGGICSLVFLLLIPFVACCILLLHPARLFAIDALEHVLHRKINGYIWNFRLCQYAIFGIAACACLFFLRLRKNLNDNKKDAAQSTKKTSVLVESLYFLASALLILFISSTTSPLYPMHTWNDSNTIFTVGRCVLDGKVIYRDLFEQKGPLLYFIHTAAALVSKTSFIGIWFIQIIFLTAFMQTMRKTLFLFTETAIWLFIPVIAAFMFTSKNYVIGDSAEEFCLLFLCIPLYFSLKVIKKGTFFSKGHLIVTGVCAACVLWIKYTMCTFFIGWLFIPVAHYVVNKNYKGILTSALFIILGCIIGTAPIFAYFAVNHALGDWFTTYFVYNLTLYNGAGHLWQVPANIAKCLFSALSHNPFMALLLMGSLYSLIRWTNKRVCLHIVFCFVTLCAGIFYGAYQTYYSFILQMFTPFCLIGLRSFTWLRVSKKSLALIPALAFIVSASLFNYLYIASSKKSEIPNYVFAEYIKRFPNATILNYGSLDDGFYMTTGIVPATKYFCKLNLNLPEMYETQERIVNEALVKFLVTTKDGGIKHAQKYRLVMQQNYLFRTYGTAYLYERIE